MSTPLRMNRIALAAALVAGLLAGCNRDPQPAPSADAAADAGTLPRPEAVPGSVTGFDGDAPPPRAAGTSAGAASDGEDTPVADAAPETGGFDLGSPPQDPVAGTTATPAAPAPTPVPAAPAPEPGAAEAAAVVRSYYGAINAGQYPRAYALWSDRMKAVYPRAENLDGRFDSTESITFDALYVASQSASDATVQANFTERYEGGSSRQFIGYWRLVRVDGRWLLDEPTY